MGERRELEREYTLNYVKVDLYKLKLCEISIIYQRIRKMQIILCDFYTTLV